MHEDLRACVGRVPCIFNLHARHSRVVSFAS